ncbi:PqqD family protein [Granulicella sp. L60]|uniref:PqqD family protein n=1 Tax=Granulicella sp. L60 TaxID=1641866 RepID=UPI00131EA13C|nr:PqqD family protein [Granulicella sp. L60]
MSEQISRSTRLINTPDGAVVMEIKSGLMFTSDPVGGRILELLKQSVPEDQIIATISRECEVFPEIVRPDLANFMAQLRSYGIVESEMPSV